jgi:ribonuclease Z
MVKHLSQAFALDIRIRKAAPEHLSPKGVQFDAKEIKEGTIYTDSSARVSAFLVDHGPVKPAFGYRVDDTAHSVVISGDTKFSPNLVKFARGTDCLIHVAWSANSKCPTLPWKRTLGYAEDAGRVFAAVRPKLGVVYHYKCQEGLEDEVRKEYEGRFTIANDLMVIKIGHTVVIDRRAR